MTNMKYSDLSISISYDNDDDDGTETDAEANLSIFVNVCFLFQKHNLSTLVLCLANSESYFMA